MFEQVEKKDISIQVGRSMKRGRPKGSLNKHDDKENQREKMNEKNSEQNKENILNQKQIKTETANGPNQKREVFKSVKNLEEKSEKLLAKRGNPK